MISRTREGAGDIVDDVLSNRTTGSFNTMAMLAKDGVEPRSGRGTLRAREPDKHFFELCFRERVLGELGRADVPQTGVRSESRIVA